MGFQLRNSYTCELLHPYCTTFCSVQNFHTVGMQRQMKLSWVLLIILHSLCLIIIDVAQAGKSLSKPDCPEKCGNVSIPYPFGIGRECSANSSFTVICKNATKPSLAGIDLEVVEISLDSNTVQVMQPVSRLNCSSREEIKMRLGKSIVESPFTFSSSYNDLVVVGCKSEVFPLASRTNSPAGGCRPICGNTTFGCNGINCCRTTIPPRAQELNIFYRSPGEGNDGVCGFAFLADYRWLRSDYKNYTSFQNSSIPLNMSTLQYAPVALEWEFHQLEENLQGVSCDWYNSSGSFANETYSFNITYCYCRRGFEGNPYLPGGGCQDIDECSNTTLNTCAVGSTCINKIGSFTCREDNRTKSTIIGVSSGIGALLLLSGAWMSSKVIRRRIKANRKKKFFKRNGGLLLQQRLSSNDGGVEKVKLFNSKELAQATDRYNENRILGHGGQGTVYKGMLPDGKIVAVKKSKRVDEVDTETFINEVVILSQVNHRNVVKLLGCCLETEVPLLVYEFIPNGTLFQHIHDQGNEFPLSWKMRVGIAAEIAGALSYMHYAASTPIYHRDIKSTNVLLDDKYRAKVSDFGTSRSIAIDQTHLTTRVLGTYGYLDPEYFQSSQFTEKSDVYSFGVVVAELLTGEKAISAVGGGRSLATHFLHSMEEDNLFDILDPEVLKEGRMEEIVAVAKLARRCLYLNGKKRPTMKEVAVELEGIQMVNEGSAFQSNHDDKEFQPVELSEVYDFSSISDSINFNTITTESSESPFLSGNS